MKVWTGEVIESSSCYQHTSADHSKRGINESMEGEMIDSSSCYQHTSADHSK